MLAGCASWRLSAPELPTRVVAAPLSQVWQAAQNVLELNHHRVRFTDPRRGTILAEAVLRGADAPSLIRAPLAERQGIPWWSLDSTLTLTLTPVSETATRVVVRSKLLGRPSLLLPEPLRARPSIVPLESNGTLERRLLDDLDGFLATPES